jgi:hypothetical protein
MNEFDKEIALIEKNNASEIQGPLKDYFTTFKKPNGQIKVTWEKAISTHIRHKVVALVKKHITSAAV